MLKKAGFKKLLKIIISLIVAVGVAITSIVLVAKKSSSQLYNNNTNRDNNGSLSPVSNGVKLILGENKVTDYYIGEEFVAPVVFGKFENSQIIDLSSSEKLTISGYDMAKTGLQVVNIEYEDGTIYGRISYKIYVNNAKPISISASYEDSEIEWGKKLDKNKLSVVLTYTNKDQKEINDYSLKYNSQPDDYGPNEAKVSYGELSTTFTVNVVQKSVDLQYKYLEDEMKSLLNTLGYINPTCPKDYSFSKDTSGNPILKAIGELTSFENQSESNVHIYLKNILFNGYTFIEGPVATYEQIFLSNRFIFTKPSENITAKIYILQLQNTYKFNLSIY